MYPDRESTLILFIVLAAVSVVALVLVLGISILQLFTHTTRRFNPPVAERDSVDERAPNTGTTAAPGADASAAGDGHPSARQPGAAVLLPSAQPVVVESGWWDGVQRETLADSLHLVLAPDESTCVICLVNMGDEDVCCRLPCMHVFHKDCILDWWMHPRKRSKTMLQCPSCRQRAATPALAKAVGGLEADKSIIVVPEATSTSLEQP